MSMRIKISLTIVGMILGTIIAAATTIGIGTSFPTASASVNCVAELEGNRGALSKQDYKEQKEGEKEKLKAGEVTKDEAKAEIKACKELVDKDIEEDN